MDNKAIGLLILRIAGGGLMLMHGIPKLMKIFNGDWGFANPIGVGAEASLVLTVFAEVICAFLILVGYKTKWATVPLIITMLVAAFIVHGADPMQKKEMAIIYGLIYLAIYFLGAGKYSLDARMEKRR